MKKLRKIISIYLDEENRAARGLVECRNLYQKQLHILEELRQYETDYKRNFSAQAMTGVRIEAIRNYNNFIEKLRALIARQLESVNAERRRVEIATTLWQEKRIERKRLDRLEEKVTTRVRHRQEKREQQQLDEIAIQRHQRRHWFD
jgi:flagellar export protein FliJ